MKATNLKLREDSYYAAVYVPPRLRQVIGRQVFRESLHTCDPGEALRKRADAVARLRQKMAAMVREAQARGNAPPGLEDWLALQVEKHRAQLEEHERQAAKERSLVAQAIDYIRQLRPDHPIVAGAVPVEPVPTFGEAAKQCIASRLPTWKRDRWSPMLARYVLPSIGATPVNEVDTAAVRAILEPIWTAKTVTADTLRGAIEATLDYAKTCGWRTGDNPARWSGHLENVLAKPRKVAPIKNHPALPWEDVPSFMRRLHEQPGRDARALAFTILTAARTQESLFAERAEIDLDAKLWTVPANRMKKGRPHRVPLSSAALALIEGQPGGRFVFPAHKGKSGHASHGAMARLLVRMGYSADAVTVHGFRSSFRDWCSDTGKDPELAEHALAHLRGDRTARAYARSDMLERRRKLMDEWAEFCLSKG